jgi:WD40 repeat protein
MDKKTNDFVEGSKGRSVLITPDKKFVIVGSKDGRVRIFSFNPESYEMKCKVTFKHAKEWISDIKFGYNLLLIGSHDNAIYVYDYDEETGDFKRKYRPLQKHSSYITHIDVSRDSCFMQSTCGAYELLFWDLNSGKQITSGASMLRDEKWATWTCNLGWPVQGIYPKCTDGTFIHSVDRSNTNLKNETYKTDEKTPYLLAGGNNNGKVCIYNFPCTIKNSGFVEGKGHSSHITNVRWN